MATTVPIDTICKLLDLTQQRVNQLAREGIIPKLERGRYELVPVVRAYIQYLRMGNLKRDLPEDDYTTHRVKPNQIKFYLNVQWFCQSSWHFVGLNQHKLHSYAEVVRSLST